MLLGGVFELLGVTSVCEWGPAGTPGRQIGDVDADDASAAAAGKSAIAPSAVAVDTAWAPLRIRVFRVLWLAQLGSLIGTWMQTVGAQWLLVDEPAAETLVALVQTANMSPVFLLALPAGVFADVFDRRRLLIVVQAAAMLIAGALAALTAAGTVTPALLLTFTFLLGSAQTTVPGTTNSSDRRRMRRTTREWRM